MTGVVRGQRASRRQSKASDVNIGANRNIKGKIIFSFLSPAHAGMCKAVWRRNVYFVFFPLWVTLCMYTL